MNHKLKIINYKLISKKVIYYIFIICNLQFATCNLYASFENICIGARATAMSSAQTAFSDDVYSIYYNPAGLARVNWKEVGLDYEKLFLGLDDGSSLTNGAIVYAQHFGNFGTIAFGMQSFALTGYYSENKYTLGYGTEYIKNKLLIGANINILANYYNETKYIQNAVNLDTGERRNSKDPVFSTGNSKTNLALDLGIIYNLNMKNSLGISLSNINQPDMGLLNPDNQPLVIKFGYAHKSELYKVATDIVLAKNSFSFLAGVERVFLNGIFLRGGIGLGTRKFGIISGGIGYSYNNISLDYSINYPIRGITGTYGSHKFSLTLKFGG